jgi:hypothetical protein
MSDMPTTLAKWKEKLLLLERQEEEANRIIYNRNVSSTFSTKVFKPNNPFQPTNQDRPSSTTTPSHKDPNAMDVDATKRRKPINNFRRKPIDGFKPRCWKCGSTDHLRDKCPMKINEMTEDQVERIAEEYAQTRIEEVAGHNESDDEDFTNGQ